MKDERHASRKGAKSPRKTKKTREIFRRSGFLRVLRVVAFRTSKPAQWRGYGVGFQPAQRPSRIDSVKCLRHREM